MPLVRFSSRDLPKRARAAQYREVLASALKLDVEGIDDHPLEVDASLRLLPGMVVARSILSPLIMDRTAAQVADGNDDFVLSIPIEGVANYRQGRRAETECAPGEAYLLLNDAPSRIANRHMSRLSLTIPRAELASRVVDLDAALKDGVASGPAMAILIRYVAMLTGDVGGFSPELERLAREHVVDLVALALGATRDAAEAAKGRGVRAARLAAIRADVIANVTRSDLSLTWVAARQGISPQYARALLNSDGTTFSDLVVKERLARVHRALTDRRKAGQPISGIVFEAGFGDLSYFHRVFRRAYGMTPSEVRAEALKGGHA